MILDFLNAVIGDIPVGFEVFAYIFSMIWLIYITKFVFSIFALLAGVSSGRPYKV